MKKKWLLILILTIICSTGCEATYNLTITKNGMTESADFLVSNTSDNQEILDQYLSSSYMAYYNMDSKQSVNYEKKELKKDDEIGMNLTHQYSGDDLQNSSLLNRCYYKKSITRTQNEIVITTDGKTTCFYKDEVKTLDRLVINIKTDLEVTENNADEIKGNTYRWIIDESNYQNHPITMKIDLTEKESSSINLPLLVIVGIILVGAITLLILIKIKNKKNNKL